MREEKNFSEFTNLYELSKTLRFELKPVGNTQKMLDENQVFQIDELKQKKYTEIKPYFDRFHREFVKESLNGIKLNNFDEYFDIYKKLKKIRKDKTKKDIKKDLDKKLEKENIKLRKRVLDAFNERAKEYANIYSGLKNNDVEIFFEEGIFEVLKERYKEDEKTIIDNVSIFDKWKGFTGYFLKFHETRKNFYRSDGKAGRISTRIIDQNLPRFCDNLELFNKIKDKIDFSELEKDFGISVVDVFDLNYYNKCLLQDDIDFYNAIIGGDSKDQNKKGINQYINLHKQETGEKLPFLKQLDKQILSEKDKFIDELENDDECLVLLKNFTDKADKKIVLLKKLLNDFVQNNDNYNLKTIYFSKEAFNTISYKWVSQTYEFQKAVAGESEEKIKEEDGEFKFKDFISLDSIKKALQNSLKEENVWKDRYFKNDNNKKGILNNEDKDKWKQFLEILSFEFKSLFEKEVVDSKTGEKRTVGYNICKPAFLDLIGTDKFTTDKNSKRIVKDFADNILWIYQMGKYFSVEKKGAWNPKGLELGDFYNNPEFGYFNKFYDGAYKDIVQSYNKIRNYLTKKPWDNNKKWKLNFKNPSLADGWDKNKESDNFAVILRKNEKYYLGLMKKGCNKIFDNRNLSLMEDGLNSEKYEKMVYKLLPGVNKMLPKVFFSNSNIDFFNPSKEILKIRNHSSHTKNGNPQKGFEKKDFNLKDCHKLIDFFKESLLKHKDWKDFNFQFSETQKYQDISSFYREVEKGGYKITFQDISEKYINEKVANSELYLFEIHNKDWNLKDGQKKTGTKNLHTMYFEALFSQANMVDFPLKLNGQAEIFFRPKISENKLGKKKDNDGKEVVDHKRFAKDKIYFHCPITLNRGADKIYSFNQKINNELLANNPDINIIGVDRGEKHLVYYSVITQKGQILDMGSLNKIKHNENSKEVNYSEKLEEKAKDREQARKDWQEVEGIKDLKKGYISQVVRKLADLAIEHNAIIVFEDLNMRFKQIRGGIEKSVYQQLEKALIEKLNYLVNKGEKDPEKAGNLLKAYQLTAPFETFKDMGKQTGILFYTQADYTSITDPVTGFRKNIYISNTASIEKIKEGINKFKEIGWDDEQESYFFRYDVRDFNKQGKGESKEWKIYANVPRIRREKNNGHWDYKFLNPNDLLKELFDVYGLKYSDGELLEQIKNKDKNGELGQKEVDGKKRDFYKSLIYILNLILQVRNSFSEKDSEGKEKEYIDFIASPVYPFFKTAHKDQKVDFTVFEKMFLNKAENKEKIKNEFNGDANGALNIARKGVVMLNNISKWQAGNERLKRENKKEIFYPDLYISYLDWDKYAQNEWDKFTQQ